MKKLILIKGNFQFTNNIIQLLKSNENSVISLDYDSHSQLNLLSINHKIYDNYISDDDRKKIDEISLNTTVSWYENPNIRDILILEGINLGELLNQEFFFHLQKTITIFLTLVRIKEMENPDELIISNDLMKMINAVFTNCNIHLLKGDEQTQQFVYDKFSIKYNIANIPLTIRVPRKYFFFLRKSYESFFIPIFNKIFFKKKKQGKSIILIDFNPNLFEDFLNHLDKKDVNVYLLNRRRAAMWNLKSLMVVKKTKAIPVSLERVLDSSDKKEIKIMKSTVMKKLDLILFQEKLLSDIFSIDGYSYWDYLREYFKNFCIARFEEACYELIGAKKLLQKINPSLILHFYEPALQEKIIVNEARKLHIETILVQHGTPALTYPGFMSLNSIMGTVPLYPGKKMIVWGNMVKDYCMHKGMPENDIIVSGSLRHDPYFHVKKNASKKNGLIIIALGQILNINSQNLSTIQHENYEKGLRLICRALKKMTHKEKIAKLHPGDMVFNTVVVEPIIRSEDKSIKIFVDADLSKLIPAADVVISLGLTTFLLDSNIFGIPTISIAYDKLEFFTTSNNGYTKLFTVNDGDEFEKYLVDLLSNTQTLDENKQKGSEFVNAYLVNHGNASEYLANKITEL